MRTGIKFINGDGLQLQGGGNKIILNLCNIDGGWRGDFKRSLSRLWPSLELQYKTWHIGQAGNDFSAGALQLIQVKSYVYVANLVSLIAQGSTRMAGNIHLPSLNLGLEALFPHAQALHASIHFSKDAFLSTALEWSAMEAILSKFSGPQNSNILVYELPPPPNSPSKMIANQLTLNFGV
jgi:hypothetical protein